MKWIKWVVAAVVAVAVLAVAAEVVLRQVIPNTVADSVRTELQLADDHPVEVELGGSALLSALRGGVSDISVDVPDIPVLEGVELDALAHADFVPFDPEHGRIRGATASLVAPADQLDALISLATQGFASTGEVKNGDIVVGGSLEVFGQSITATATFGLQIEGGDLVIEPKALDAAGFDLDVEQLRGLAPRLAEPVVGAHTVCVRDRLPAGVKLTRLTLDPDGSARISAKIAPGILSDPTQLDPGTCD